MVQAVARWTDGPAYTDKKTDGPAYTDKKQVPIKKAVHPSAVELPPEENKKICIEDVLAALEQTLEEKRQIRKAASYLLQKLER